MLARRVYYTLKTILFLFVSDLGYISLTNDFAMEDGFCSNFLCATLLSLFLMWPINDVGVTRRAIVRNKIQLMPKYYLGKKIEPTVDLFYFLAENMFLSDVPNS